MILHRFGAWFAIQVISKREKAVTAILEYKGYELFVPTYKVRKVWSDRIKTLETPLFPGYVFCRIQGVPSGLIPSTPGVIRIVGQGNKPMPIPDDEIHALQQMIENKIDLTPFPYLNLGDRVTISHGPLAGISGIAVTMKSRQKLIVSVALIMRSVMVEVDINDVSSERVPPERVLPERALISA